MSKDYSDIQEAVRALASVCDGAVSEDAQGYNGTDAKYGARMAKMPQSEWTKADAHVAGKMLKKYSGQLDRMGIDYNSLEVPELDEDEDEKEESDKSHNKAYKSSKRPYLKISGELVTVFNSYDIRTALYQCGLRFNKKSGPEAGYAGILNSAVANGLLNISTLSLSHEQREELLSHVGNDVDAPTPDNDTINVFTEGDHLVLRSEWGQVPLQLIRALPGRKWDGDRKVNLMSPSLNVLEMVTKFGLNITPDAMALVEKASAKEKALLDASRAVDTNMTVALGDIMRPYQKAGSAYMVEHGRAINGDDMGLGKTIQSLSAVETVNAYPCIIVCPASLKLNWANEIRKWLPNRTWAIYEGRNGNGGTAADFVIINYDILADNMETASTIVRSRNGKPKTVVKVTGIGDLPSPSALIIDESHYIKEQSSRRTKAVTFLAAKVPNGNPVFLLTGTPLLNDRSRELVPQLLALGYLTEEGGHDNSVGKFLYRYCDPQPSARGTEFNGHTNDAELASWLRQTCLVRRTKEQVLTELPPKQRAQQFTQLSAADMRVYNQLKDEAAKYAKKTKAEQLVFMTKVKRAIGIAKIPAAITWIEDFLLTGRQLVVFAYHKEVQDALINALRNSGHEVTQILGGQSTKVTEEQKAKFMSGESNVMVASLKAAKEGHTLTSAHNVFVPELNWTPGEHNQAEDRTHRIGQTLPVMIWYLLSTNTIDNSLFDRIERKRSAINAIVDGEGIWDDDDETDIITQLIEEMAA